MSTDTKKIAAMATSILGGIIAVVLSAWTTYTELQHTTSAIQQFNLEMRGEFENSAFYRAGLEKRFQARLKLLNQKVDRVADQLSKLESKVDGLRRADGKRVP